MRSGAGDSFWPIAESTVAKAKSISKVFFIKTPPQKRTGKFNIEIPTQTPESETDSTLNKENQSRRKGREFDTTKIKSSFRIPMLMSRVFNPVSLYGNTR
jgi:hypothetical protein